MPRSRRLRARRAAVALAPRLATGVIVALIWMEAIRKGVARAAAALHVPAITDWLVWVRVPEMRALLRLGVECLMTAVILVLLAQSASGVRVQRVLGRRLLPA